nr:unnamed protein product [Callosobruchus chinensis]
MSEDEISTPTTAQYRTVPLKPQKIMFDRDKITKNSFVVHWEPPSGRSEFDKYQISLGTKKTPPVPRPKEESTQLEFNNLEPGKTYSVIVKTVSGKVTSWPVSAEVTLTTTGTEPQIQYRRKIGSYNHILAARSK